MAGANHNIEVRDGRDDLPIFIHSELDDYPLTPLEFRVYARVARRCGTAGKFFEGPGKLAKAWGVGDRTIERCLLVLVGTRLVHKEVLGAPRPSRYTLTPRRTWVPADEVEAIRAQVYGKKAKPDSVTGDTINAGDSVTGDTINSVTGDTIDSVSGDPLSISLLKVLPEGTPKDSLSAGAREAVVAFETTFGHPPHLHGQTEIEAEALAADFDPVLWLQVLRQCRTNLTPAKNVGTMLSIYREQRQRRQAVGERAAGRAAAHETATEGSGWQSREVFLDDIMRGYDLTEDEARAKFPKLRLERDAA